jgi:hypothetical protein
MLRYLQGELKETFTKILADKVRKRKIHCWLLIEQRVLDTNAGKQQCLAATGV